MYVTDDLTIPQLDNRAVRVTGEAMMIFSYSILNLRAKENSPLEHFPREQ